MKTVSSSAMPRTATSTSCSWPWEAGPGARLSRRLACSVSRSTLLRLIRALPERPAATPRVLGDFALQSLDATETADFYQLCVERTSEPPPSSLPTAPPNG
jgi:hypothetical protein